MIFNQILIFLANAILSQSCSNDH